MGISVKSRIRGAMLGHACADALGAPLEFRSRELNLITHSGELRELVGGGSFGWAPGEWTDDTGMMLCVAEGILENPSNPVGPIGKRFIEWAKTAKDIGSTIGAVISSVRRGATWQEAAEMVSERNAPRNASNGSLMRTLPVALAYADRSDVERSSALVSGMTHWNPEVELACDFFNRFVSRVLSGEGKSGAYLESMRDAFEYAQSRRGFVVPCLMKELYPLGQRWVSRFVQVGDKAYEELQPSGYAGYVVECFEAAAWCFLNTDSFEECVVKAANLGGEADTIAAVAGGIAGAYYGVEAIPARWLAVLHDRERIERDADAIAELRGQ